MKMTALLVAAAAGLGGCASNRERSDRECSGRGYNFGTPGYEACYQSTMARHQNFDMELIGLGFSMMSGR
jgi:hypothetical protein